MFSLFFLCFQKIVFWLQVQNIFFRCRENARKEMTELIKIMEIDQKTKKVARLKDWFVAREAQMAQLSLEGTQN